MWQKLIDLLAYYFGTRAGVAQEKQAEQTATVTTLEQREKTDAQVDGSTDAGNRNWLRDHAGPKP